MKNVTIYHNPRCSKSRETLALLEQHGVDPKVVLYLETPPSADELKKLLKELGFTSARDLMRKRRSVQGIEAGGRQPERRTTAGSDDGEPETDRTPDRGERQQGAYRPAAGAGAGDFVNSNSGAHCRALSLRSPLQPQDLFNERDGQLALGGDRGAIELIEGHKQRAHLAIQPFQQEAAHVFRQLEAAQFAAQLQRQQFSSSDSGCSL